MQDLFESANLKSIKQQLTTKTPSPAKVCTIEQIQSNSDLITISGLVISKYEMREVCTVRDQQQKVSYVLNFILRDSEVDFINVSVWGSSREFVENAVEKVQISFPIRIKNANVKLVTAVDVDQQFNPWTPCPYHLNVSENYGLFEKVEQRDDLEQLTCLPIRDHNDFYTIEDILSSEENDQKDVNLLFIVREIGQPQEVRTKNGKRLSKLELVVCDQTKDHFKLVLWDSELIQFALNWQKMVHVIFAVDVVVRYSAYEKTMFASASRKSIFTVNPCTKEGFQLYSFAKTVQLAPILPVVEQWKSQAIRCNIDELRNLFCQDMLNSEYVLLNAVISEFNIDASDFSKNFSLRCNTCYSKVDNVSRRCFKRDCFRHDDSITNYSRFFDCTVSVSDHTSTLPGVRVNGKLFNKIFGFSLDTDYERVASLTPEEVTNLKWKILLERWSMLIKITTKSIEEDDQDYIKYFFKIVSLEEVDHN